MQNLINRPIGAGLENNPDDIRIVRGTLKGLKGDEIIPEKLSGFIDDELDTDIRNFQHNAGLVEDGRLNPKGETERNLISRITGEGIDIAAPEDTALRRSVGDGGDNDPADVVAAKRALGTLGYLKYDRTAPPSPIIDAQTVAALSKFQQDNNLLTDGRADADGETIATIQELLEEISAGKTPRETQVALGPALIPLIIFLARAAPHIIKTARGAAAIAAANSAANAPLEKERKRRSREAEDSEFTGNRSEGIKLEHIPPDLSEFGDGKTVFPPHDPDKNDGKLEGRPTDPVAQPPTVFPLPKNPENLVQIFPGNTAKPELPLIIERKGNEPTRAFNARLTRLFEKLGDKFGGKIIHIGGSRDASGAEIPETHLKNRDTGGLKGGSFPDITIEIPGKKMIRAYINTADTYADGVSLTTREENAAKNLMYNMEENAVLITLPKARANQMIDFDALEEMLETTMKDLKDIAECKVEISAFGKRISMPEKLPVK